MDDFDAKNHIRDLRRYAEQRRLARLVQADTTSKQEKRVNPNVSAIRTLMLRLTFVR